jgi:Raf kinase inhibitor-like YbhB/YbcL family protein
MARRIINLLLLGLFLILACVACQASSPVGEGDGEGQMPMTISSTAFSEGDEIPRRHTCDGDDLSPPLSWSGAPHGAQSLVMITDDPDAPAGTFVHWVLFNIPPDTSSLSEGVSGVGIQGINGFGKGGYGGPCPPKGPAHRYFFKMYALDTSLNLQSSATKSEVEMAMQGHVLAQGQLMGSYER